MCKVLSGHKAFMALHNFLSSIALSNLIVLLSIHIKLKQATHYCPPPLSFSCLQCHTSVKFSVLFPYCVPEIPVLSLSDCKFLCRFYSTKDFLYNKDYLCNICWKNFLYAEIIQHSLPHRRYDIALSLFLIIFSCILILFLVSEKHHSLFLCTIRFLCHIFHQIIFFYLLHFDILNTQLTPWAESFAANHMSCFLTVNLSFLG